VNNQRDYLFSIFDNLSTDYSSAQWVNNEITRAKNIVSTVRQYERDGMPVSAETEVKKLFRL
jgi:hypothetical protein